MLSFCVFLLLRHFGSDFIVSIPILLKKMKERKLIKYLRTKNGKRAIICQSMEKKARY
jgi:hypothetical protein